MERLQKVLAESNVSSRRKAEELILAGRVKVNGEVVKELGVKVSKSDQILVDNKEIKKATKKALLVNKPSGYLTTNLDEKNRPKVADLFKTDYPNERFYPVDGLEYETAGIVIYTNDGELKKKLTSAKKMLEMEYIVRVDGIITRKEFIAFRLGIKLDKKQFRPNEAKIIELDKANQTTLVKVSYFNVKEAEIKAIFNEFGFPVKKITRFGFAFLKTEGVIRGGYRELTIYEFKKLHSIQSKS